jgi:hypothetical protein
MKANAEYRLLCLVQKLYDEAQFVFSYIPKDSIFPVENLLPQFWKGLLVLMLSSPCVAFSNKYSLANKKGTMR